MGCSEAQATGGLLNSRLSLVRGGSTRSAAGGPPTSERWPTPGFSPVLRYAGPVLPPQGGKVSDPRRPQEQHPRRAVVARVQQLPAGDLRVRLVGAAFEHGQRARRDPAALGQALQRRLAQALAVGRIEEGQVEGGAGGGRAAGRGRWRRAGARGCAPNRPMALDVVADRARARPRRSPRTGRRPRRATGPPAPARPSPRTGRSPARPQAPRPGRVLQDVEHRLARAVRRRPRGNPFRRLQALALKLSRHDAHAPLWPVVPAQQAAIVLRRLRRRLRPLPVARRPALLSRTP